MLACINGEKMFSCRGICPYVVGTGGCDWPLKNFLFCICIIVSNLTFQVKLYISQISLIVAEGQLPNCRRSVSISTFLVEPSLVISWAPVTRAALYHATCQYHTPSRPSVSIAAGRYIHTWLCPYKVINGVPTQCSPIDFTQFGVNVAYRPTTRLITYLLDLGHFERQHNLCANYDLWKFLFPKAPQLSPLPTISFMVHIGKHPRKKTYSRLYTYCGNIL